MIELSSRQWRILRAIECSWQERSYAPTTRELMAAADVSSSSVVSYNVHKLARDGLVMLVPATQRTLRLTALGQELLAGRCLPSGATPDA